MNLFTIAITGNTQLEIGRDRRTTDCSRSVVDNAQMTSDTDSSRHCCCRRQSQHATHTVLLTQHLYSAQRLLLSTVRDLSIILDSKLSFEPHISQPVSQPMFPTAAPQKKAVCMPCRWTQQKQVVNSFIPESTTVTVCWLGLLATSSIVYGRC